MTLFRYRFQVEFEISDAELFITGSLPQLGSCNPDIAPKLEWLQKNTFSIDNLLLPSSFEYNFFYKKNGVYSFETLGKRTSNFHDGQEIDDSLIEICIQEIWNKRDERAITFNRKKWWKESTVYEIYPRSFCDSNGDGIGDIQGIISKLDYLKYLGVDVLWLCPVYKSPNIDNGYDISDYSDISEEYGNMQDFDELVREAKNRGLKLMMDLVLNHTSEKHRWFLESKRSKTNKFRDFYIWRPPNRATGKEPNNWRSLFGGSAWELDPISGEYYLHLFSKAQPDLNWENPKVREGLFEMMQFWVDKGVQGFRMDVLCILSKVHDFPDAPETDREHNIKMEVLFILKDLV